jgi:hypothetical protein
VASTINVIKDASKSISDNSRVTLLNRGVTYDHSSLTIVHNDHNVLIEQANDV